MKSKVLLSGILGLFLCSCSTIYHTSSTVGVQTEIVSFTVADVDVSPAKVQKTYSWSYNPFKRVSISTVKSNTTAELLNQSGADVLVDPQYVVEQRGFLRGGSVTVIGFPGTYKNFHTMTEAEAKIASEIIDAKNKEQKPQKRFFFF